MYPENGAYNDIVRIARKVTVKGNKSTRSIASVPFPFNYFHFASAVLSYTLMLATGILFSIVRPASVRRATERRNGATRATSRGALPSEFDPVGRSRSVSPRWIKHDDKKKSFLDVPPPPPARSHDRKYINNWIDNWTVRSGRAEQIAARARDHFRAGLITPIGDTCQLARCVRSSRRE